MVTWGANRLKWYSLVFPYALVKPWNVHDERLRVNDTERSKLRSEWFMHRTISFISLNFPRIHMLLGGNSLSKEILPMLPISIVLPQAVRAVRLGWTQTCSLDANKDGRSLSIISTHALHLFMHASTSKTVHSRFLVKVFFFISSTQLDFHQPWPDSFE